MWIENLGIVATVVILISMSCKTMTYKGSLIMRITNIIGSALFTVYGFILPAYSTGILNAILIFVNTYHLINIILEHKKQDLATAEESSKKSK